MVTGILAFQGGVAEHRKVLAALGVEAIDVRTVKELLGITHLLIPGGESTVIGAFLKQSGIGEEIRRRVRNESLAVFGTCAGAILLSQGGLIDIDVERNAYGRQSDSFDATLAVEGVLQPLHAAFIRAPKITRVGSGVQILAMHQEIPVVVRQGRILAATCHPELRGETALHRLFLSW